MNAFIIICLVIVCIVGIAFSIFTCIGFGFANSGYDTLEEFIEAGKSVSKRKLFENLISWAESHSPKDYPYNKKNYYDACDAWAEDLFKQIPIYKVRYETAVKLCRKVYDFYKEKYNLYDRDWAAEDTNKQRYENWLAQQQQGIQDKVDQLMNKKK